MPDEQTPIPNDAIEPTTPVSPDSGFEIDMPDIPMPGDTQDDAIQDELSSPAAFKFAFCGSGQGGCRLVESFYKLGYRRIAAINTALQDLEGLDLPAIYKMEIATGGAGKNPQLAEKYIRDRREDVYDLMARRFGSQFDRLFLVIGGGGGTGSGSITTLIESAHELLQSHKIENPDDEGNFGSKVGVICTLPMRSESRQVNGNSAHIVRDLLKYIGPDAPPARRISPLILVDNERIKTIYPGVSVQDFWASANRSITTLFHVFNLLAEKPTRYSVFDKNDFEDVLSSGLVTFGATPVKAGTQATSTDISYAIRDNLQKNVLVGGIDLRTGSKAACIFVGDNDVLKTVSQVDLEHGFEQLSRIMGSGSVVHRGIYSASKPGLAIYTMVGGLLPPLNRVKELAAIGGQSFDDWDLLK